MIKYSPQHPTLRHPHPTFVRQCERPVSHPQKTKGKSIVLCIIIFMFSDSKLKTNDSAPNDSKHPAT